MFQRVNATADNGFINVSWVFRHTGGQEIDDVEVLCSTSGEGSSGGLYDMFSCDMNDCSNSNLMGGTKVGPVTAGLSYSCRITAINNNGSDSRTIDNINATEGKDIIIMYTHIMSTQCLYMLLLCLPSSPPSLGIPSSPELVGNITNPGSLTLRLRTEFPGDTNIRFIVNITDSVSGSHIDSVSEPITNYQSNSIVDVTISLPDGGSVSVSIVTYNQYGVSDTVSVSGVFTVQPSEYYLLL